MSESTPEPVHYRQPGPAPYAPPRSTGQGRIVSGALWLIAGVLITVISFAVSGGDGFHIIAFGPIVYGLVRIASGVRRTGRT